MKIQNINIENLGHNENLGAILYNLIHKIKNKKRKCNLTDTTVRINKIVNAF